MHRKRYVAPEMLSHQTLMFETQASPHICDDNGKGDDINANDPDRGLGYCETSNPQD